MIARVLALVLVVAAAAARADDIATDRFRPGLDGRGLVDVEGADVGRHLDGGAALWLGWDHQPLELVGHRAIARITGSLSLFDFVAIGGEVPAVLDRGALGDLRFLAKVQALRADSHAIDLAIAAAVTLPTAAANAFVGEHELTFAPELLVGRAFGDLRVNAQGGVHVRPVTTFRGLAQGAEARLRAGAGYQIPGLPVDVEGSASIALPMYAARPTLEMIPVEALLATRIDLPLHFPLQLVGFFGLGLGSAVGTPTARAGLALVASFAGPPAPAAPPAAPAAATKAPVRADPFVDDTAPDPVAEHDATDADEPANEAGADEAGADEGADDAGEGAAVEVDEMAFDDEALLADDDTVFAEEIAFEAGSAELAPSAAAQLDEVAALWRALALDLEVAAGPDADRSLTEQRSEVLRAALVARGVAVERLGAGAERALTSTDVLFLVARAQSN